MFTKNDIAQIEAHGLTVECVERQMENFRRGFAPLSVVRAATVGDGIVRLSAEQVETYINIYIAEKTDALKFVPASGAATRMFKDLFAFAEGVASPSAEKTVENAALFAFADELGALEAPLQIARRILDTQAAKPKGLIKFHRYADGARTAAQEHVAEGATYNIKRLHFTVSPEHEAGFHALLDDKNITFSTQKPQTDTIAATPEGEPFRDADGQLLFRPAGHGALLENLNEVEAELIFIKNIDNVCRAELRADTTRFKQVLAGMALALQAKIFGFLRGTTCLLSANAMKTFIENELCYKLPVGTTERDMREVLNRPLRVCAMVRNEGEPGGGPFWASNADGSQQLQIAESAQVGDKSLFEKATHFNPVDMVCCTRDAGGGRFDLRRYVDANAGFISAKSVGGRALLAQELPGLWNGSMARWNTVFVEVPASTFTPVKEVNDLLRKEHCGE